MIGGLAAAFLAYAVDASLWRTEILHLIYEIVLLLFHDLNASTSMETKALDEASSSVASPKVKLSFRNPSFMLASIRSVWRLIIVVPPLVSCGRLEVLGKFLLVLRLLMRRESLR